jgi:hypothetical protein
MSKIKTKTLPFPAVLTVIDSSMDIDDEKNIEKPIINIHFPNWPGCQIVSKVNDLIDLRKMAADALSEHVKASTARGKEVDDILSKCVTVDVGDGKKKIITDYFFVKDVYMHVSFEKLILGLADNQFIISIYVKIPLTFEK